MNQSFTSLLQNTIENHQRRNRIIILYFVNYILWISSTVRKKSIINLKHYNNSTTKDDRSTRSKQTQSKVITSKQQTEWRSSKRLRWWKYEDQVRRKKCIKRDETYFSVSSQCREEKSDEDEGKEETTRRHFRTSGGDFRDLGRKKMGRIGLYTGHG